MKALLLSGGRVIDPANGLDTQTDLLIEEGRITALGAEAGARAPRDCRWLQLDGLVVAPGLVDLHVHLREPGQNAKETIATGTRAAAQGGFSSVLCMPNTTPPVDNAGTVALIQERARREGVVNVFVAGALSKGLAGEELAPIGSLKRAGVMALTDDGHCVQNHELMRRALEYARTFDLPVLDHCQDYSLVTEGVMHEGYWSTVLGLRGWPSAGEEAIVGRNVLLAELTGAPLHCQHVSSAGSVRLLREARSRGVPITGEACPHHFVLTDASIAGSAEYWRQDGQTWIAAFLGADEIPPAWPPYDTHLKMNPPLRSALDRQAVIDAVVDGTLNVVSTDHAPHCDFEKEVEFDYAPFGIIGLETALSLALMQFYHSGRLTLSALIDRLSGAPARLLHLPKGTLSIGADADVAIIDTERSWTVSRDTTASKSQNTPFTGWRLRGKAMATIVGGAIAWEDPALAPRWQGVP
jgi:dihydroorotase